MNTVSFSWMLLWSAPHCTCGTGYCHCDSASILLSPRALPCSHPLFPSIQTSHLTGANAFVYLSCHDSSKKSAAAILPGARRLGGVVMSTIAQSGRCGF